MIIQKLKKVNPSPDFKLTLNLYLLLSCFRHYEILIFPKTRSRMTKALSRFPTKMTLVQARTLRSVVILVLESKDAPGLHYLLVVLAKEEIDIS